MTHFIRQQFFEVDLKGSESAGFALQHHLSDLYYSKLLPAIEKVFDQFAPPDQVVVIDRLGIDAGTIRLDQIDEQLTKIVTEALIHRLKFEDATNGINSAGKDRSNHLKSIVAQKNTDFDKSLQPAKVRSHRHTDENLWEVFISFLHKGFLPWYYKLPKNKDLEEVMSELLFKSGNRSGWVKSHKKLKDALLSGLALKRLVLQFSETFILNLIGQIAPDSADILVKLFKESGKATFASEEVKKSIKQLLLEKAVLRISVDGKFTIRETEKQILRELKFKSELVPLFSKVFEHPLPDFKTVQNKPDHSEFRDNAAMTDPEMADGIYIENAGLVLLHPFLPRFFETLGLADDGELLQPERGLSLLHYLATGQTKIHEYELVLPKILCGVLHGATLPVGFEITENEQNEASALLDAVISHWEALRNTSQDGLRETFLLRPGKLSRKEDGDWLLQVESRTFDILLDQLPWGLSMIKLPWMRQMLWVEWWM